ncbi:oxidoreductase [Streptomyces coelicoflavus]|uniref:Oxidoreductase n=1 Tax=Streptomyces coelicoflavus TaxID=285562 RepID=A0A7K3PYM4_9ACTN|nr:oxidoreductase [Streptomyces coelicoflavus]NEB14269.1 oxidoreductase [Streptomyces coelicoflavus]
MTAVLRWTGVEKAVSFYRYFAFDLPVVTTLSALGLLLGFTAVQLWTLFTHRGVPGYFTAYLALLAAASVCAVAGIVLGWATRDARLRRGGRLAWVLGSAVSLASVAVHLFSRTAGLGGLGELRGRWDYVPGTLTMALAGLFVALHFSVLTGLNVAAPDRRHWHD